MRWNFYDDDGDGDAYELTQVRFACGTCHMFEWGNKMVEVGGKWYHRDHRPPYVVAKKLAPVIQLVAKEEVQIISASTEERQAA